MNNEMKYYNSDGQQFHQYQQKYHSKPLIYGPIFEQGPGWLSELGSWIT